MVLTPKEEKDASLLVGHHTKIHSPMSLHYILFGRVCDLLHRLEHIFEDPAISLLPQIPHDIDNNSIETPTILLGTQLASISQHPAKEAGSCCGSCTNKFSQVST